MATTYQKVADYPFYSPNEFTTMQLVSRGKSSLYTCQHKQTRESFMVKEVAYSEETLRVYEAVMKLQYNESLVRIKGLCKMIVKIGKDANKKMEGPNEQCLSLEDRDNGVSRFSLKSKQSNKPTYYRDKKCEYLVVFMEKYEENLAQHIVTRRKEKKSFKLEEVSNFLMHTLYLLETFEKENLSHRDIKPENFLYDKGRFKLCDFENSIFLDPLVTVDEHFDLSTVEFTSPEFYRNFKELKTKVFDPYKMDVYSLGLTILMMCSLGNFDLAERKEYLLENSINHEAYVKEHRRRYLKNNDEFKSLNSIVKLMLEEDEYKRDSFITLLIKIKPILSVKEKEVYNHEEEVASDYSRSEESRKRIRNGEKKKIKKKNEWEGTTELQKSFLKILFILGFSFYVLILII